MKTARFLTAAAVTLALAGCASATPATAQQLSVSDPAPLVTPSATASPVSGDPYQPSPADLSGFPIRLTVSDWQGIDATMDNFSQDAQDGGDDVGATNGSLVRYAGWVEIAHWSISDQGAGNWPPKDQVTTMRLTVAHWRLVTRALDGDAKTYAQLAKGWKPTGPLDDYAAIAADSKRQAELIRAALKSANG